MHEPFMRRALDLALQAPSTSPNPRVGAVVVRDGEIVAEGGHRGPGTPHAESVALDAAGAGARGTTVYVNLEPCAHHGRTPPCAPLLVAAGVSRVVAALEDPDERVAGRGFELLRDGGIDVVVGVLVEEAEEANRAYLHHRRTGRPLLSLKLALTIDGRLAAADGSSRWITGEGARRRVHERRARADAVLVGAGTAVADDPQLTVRAVSSERQPTRVVVDSSGRVPPWSRIFDGGEVLIATGEGCPPEAEVAWKEAGAEVVKLPTRDGGVDPSALLQELGRRGCLDVLCEGGGELATALLKGDLVDRLEIHRGGVLTGRGGAEIGDVGIASMDAAPRWELREVERIGDDVLTTYERKRG